MKKRRPTGVSKKVADEMEGELAATIREVADNIAPLSHEEAWKKLLYLAALGVMQMRYKEDGKI